MSERQDRPQYGEYAPRDETQPAVSNTPETPASAPTQLSGVPHNLGVSTAATQPAATQPAAP